MFVDVLKGKSPFRDRLLKDKLCFSARKIAMEEPGGKDLQVKEITCKKSTAITLFAVLIQSVGLLLFMLGFFPVKPALKGVSGIESLNSSCYETVHRKPNLDESNKYQEKIEIRAQYNRVVLMVIDGLPAEFLIGKSGIPPSNEMVASMPFTQSLLSRKEAIGYHVKAAPPTVTMPRLKALTSGAIAGFLDVALNFNTQALLGDSLIGQLAQAGWTMLMYGDETWLRLFPNTFARHDGVSSFFVRDTVEVDENVTRHLSAELTAQDWDLLILHYLGLDHVGHLGGRTSPLMAPKLREMDMVIQQLHASLFKSNAGRQTLLMVVSDHGMTHGGNHGGASFEETDAVALFITGNCSSKSVGAENDQAFQVDLVPTLALLLGVPIPINSVGVLLPELFASLTATEKLRALEINSWQIMRLLKVRSPRSPCLTSFCSNHASVADLQQKHDDEGLVKLCSLFRKAKDLHRKWNDPSCRKKDTNCNLVDWETVAAEYLSFLHAASAWLASGTTEKNNLFIYSGGLLMLFSLIVLIVVSLWVKNAVSGLPSSIFEFQTYKLENVIALAGVCGHALSLNSSSFVEEEQFILHYLAVTLWCAFLRRECQQASSFQAAFFWRLTTPSTVSLSVDNSLVNFNLDGTLTESKYQHINQRRRIINQVLAIVAVLVAGRLLRAWHRSGVNWAHLPDIAKWLEQAHPLTLLASKLMSLAFLTVIICVLILEQTPRNFMQRFAATSLSSAASIIVLYNVWTVDRRASHWPNILAKMVYAILGCTALSILLVSPWFMSSFVARMTVLEESKKTTKGLLSRSQDWHSSRFLVREQACLNFIGKVFISCWCLLQLLLQNSVNAIPVVVLLLQFINILIVFNNSRPAYSSWLKVLTLYWMGASGHFGLGNTNTLATVDVAGAYIGLNHHSIFLSGLLAFIITYASPLLYMMGIILMASSIGSSGPFVLGSTDTTWTQLQHWKLEANVLPCVVPLAISSVILVVFTVVMLLMQGHLFIWSVFSPKYLYVCFTILSTYFGVLINAFVFIYTSLIVHNNLKL